MKITKMHGSNGFTDRNRVRKTTFAPESNLKDVPLVMYRETLNGASDHMGVIPIMEFDFFERSNDDERVKKFTAFAKAFLENKFAITPEDLSDVASEVGEAINSVLKTSARITAFCAGLLRTQNMMRALTDNGDSVGRLFSVHPASQYDYRALGRWMRNPANGGNTIEATVIGGGALKDKADVILLDGHFSSEQWKDLIQDATMHAFLPPHIGDDIMCRYLKIYEMPDVMSTTYCAFYADVSAYHQAGSGASDETRARNAMTATLYRLRLENITELSKPYVTLTLSALGFTNMWSRYDWTRKTDQATIYIADSSEDFDWFIKNAALQTEVFQALTHPAALDQELTSPTARQSFGFASSTTSMFGDEVGVQLEGFPLYSVLKNRGRDDNYQAMWIPNYVVMLDTPDSSPEDFSFNEVKLVPRLIANGYISEFKDEATEIADFIADGIWRKYTYAVGIDAKFMAPSLWRMYWAIDAAQLVGGGEDVIDPRAIFANNSESVYVAGTESLDNALRALDNNYVFGYLGGTQAMTDPENALRKSKK